MKTRFTRLLLVLIVSVLSSFELKSQTASSNITFSNFTTTSFTISWTNGSGVGRIAALRASPNGIAYPVNLTVYTASSNFGSGSNLGSSNYVVYKGTGSTVTVTGLSPFTYYTVDIFEYNGSASSPSYVTSPYGIAGHYTLSTQPTTAPSAMTVSAITNTTATVSWTNGNGTYALGTVKAGTSNTNLPSDGIDYASSTNYGSGGAVGSFPYSYVVFDGGGTSVPVSGLSAATDYVASVFGYNGYSGGNNYLTTAPTVGFTTLANSPTSYSNSLNVRDVTHDAMTISWIPATSGGGANYLVLMQENTSANDAPIDMNIYTGSTTWGSGSLIGNSYVVYNGPLTACRVNNLTDNSTYQIRVYDYNGGTGTYNPTTNYTTGFQQTSVNTNEIKPSVPASNISFTSITPTSVQVNWTSGDGQYRVVTTQPGHKRTGLAFDGTNDYVAVPYNAAFQPTAQLTAECWTYRSNWAASIPSAALVSNTESGGYRINISGTTLYGWVYRNASYATLTAPIGHLSPGWHHLALTYDGRYSYILVDGAPVAFNDAGGSYPIAYAYSNSLIIGAEAGTTTVPTGEYFNGAIDEVRIWNTAIYSSTINTNKYTTMLGNESGLVGQWKFDEGYQTASVAANTAPLGAVLNGTLNNMGTAAATAFTGTSGWILSAAPVNTPIDFNYYYSNSQFAFGASVGLQTHCNYHSSGNSCVITGLSPNTYYNFDVVEENVGQLSYNYAFRNDTYTTGDVLTAPQAVPVVNTLTPAAGQVGTLVTIAGSNFDPTPLNNVVLFGGMRATVVSASATSLVVVVPYGATYVPVSVGVNGITGTCDREFTITSACTGVLNAGSFTNTNHAAGGITYGLHIRDADNDAHPDIFTTGYGSSTFQDFKTSSVNGATPTTFAGQNSYTTLAWPYYIKTCDFDGDDRPDVITTSYNASSIGIKRYISTNYYGAPLTLATLSAPSQLDYGDFDGDGKMDIVVGYSSGSVISVFRNMSTIDDIEFATRQDITVGTNVNPFAVMARDFDGDRKADIAVGPQSGTSFYVLRSTGTPGTITFATPVAISTVTGYVNGIAGGDFDNDGDGDIVVTLSTNVVRAYRNNSTIGNISFALGTTVTALASTPYGVCANDLDGDGKADLIVGYSSVNTVSIFEANGSFSFLPKVDLPTSGTSSLAVASVDVNWDGKPEIISSTGASSINILSNIFNPLVNEPSTPSSAITFPVIGQNSMTVSWTAGTGANRVVVARQGAAPNIYPFDGVGYTANANFGSGTDLGGGQYIVYNGNSNSVNVTGLLSNTNYYFAIFEYDGATCTANYLTSPYVGGNTFTLNTPPTIAAISNPTAICMNSGLQTVNFSGVGTGAANETQTLSITASSNNTGLIPNPVVTYTSPNPTGSLSYTPVVGQYGTAVITVTVNDNATNNNITTRTFTVTVTQPPSTANAGPSQNVCISTATLGANAPAVGTGTWSIFSTTNVSITTANLGNVNIPTTTLSGLLNGDVVVLAWTISNGSCTPSTDTVTIRRAACPLTAGFTWSPVSLCAISAQVNNISFTDASYAPSTTITSWSWSFAGPITPNPSSSTAQNPANIQFTGPGTFTVSLTVNDNAAGFSTSTQLVTINPYPSAAGVISTLSTIVCEGQNNVAFSVNPIANATSYNWTLPPGATIQTGAGTSSILVSFGIGSTSGPMIVQGVNSCGVGASSPVMNITVNPLPGAAGSISGPTTVCQGQTGVVYSCPTISQATSYTWTLPVGATITSGSGTNSITVSYAANAQPGTITVMGTNTCGSGTVSTPINISINPLPDPAGTVSCSSGINVCQGETGVIYSITALNNSNFYHWSLPPGATIVSGDSTTSITVDFSASAASGNVIVYGVNGCGNGTSTTFAVTVNPLPDAATAILGADSVCQGQTGVTYFISAINNATGYNWTLPSGATIVSGNNTNSITVDFSANAQGGIVSVQGTNSCGNGIVSPVINLVVNPLPDSSGNIVGPSAVCQGQSGVTFSVSTVNHATGYNWYLPPGASIVSGNNTNSITVDFSTSAVSGPVYVEATNNCGTGIISDTIPLIVNPLPDAALSISGPTTISICPQSTGITFAVPNVNNASYYVWSLPAGATITGGDSTNTITVDFAVNASSGAVVVYGENACGQGASVALNISVHQVTPSDICMVTVDGNSIYNHVVWEKPVVTDIDSFRIYREITSNVYVPVGAVPYDSFSVFVDSVYIPLANPNTTYFRYEISSVDSCGNESVLSQHHATLFMQANVGVGNVVNLNWNLYEGANVSYYRILRDSTGLGNWQAIDSVPGTVFNYTDNNPPLSVSVQNINYKLQTIWLTSCSPSRNINTSESNVKGMPIGAFSAINEYGNAALVNVYPNPSDGNLTVEYPGQAGTYTFEVIDALGRVVYTSVESGKDGAGMVTSHLDLSHLAKGAYTLSISSGTSRIHKKIVLQ